MTYKRKPKKTLSKGFVYNSTLGVSGQKFEYSQMMLPPFDSPFLLGSHLKPKLTQHSELFSVLVLKP